MTKSKAQTENAKICASALRLAAAQGWENVTLDAVAKGAKISSTIIKKRFAAPHELVAVIVEEISREALAVAGKPSGTAHDILFDLLMVRFDVLQKNRNAILSIAEAARRDVALSRALTRAVLNGLYSVIDVAALNTPPRPVLAAGLSAVYGWAFLAWRRDESRDMAKTMAALDRGLRLAGKATEVLKRRF